MPDRIYTDTSVIGGCEDDEFRVHSRRLLDAFVRGDLTLVLSELTLRERISIDWNEWAGARDRLGNAERVRSASAEVAESYARQYIAGRKSWLDVLNAVRESAQADLARVDARYQMLSAAWRLGIHTGRWE